jgi:predicted amino acid-binding ACT domain protein
MDTGRNKFGIANAVMRKLREHECIFAEGEQRVMAQNLDEIMVVEADGSFNRYKKVNEND